MNDDELREHLRTTLDAVRPDHPNLSVLRRTARRRRRRLQLTAGCLGLLLIAGTGLGIAEATTSGNGQRAVVAAAPSGGAAADVTASCDSAPTGPPGSNAIMGVVLAPGQSLGFVDCPEGARATAPAGSVLTQTGPLTFVAVGPGSEKVVVTFAMCAELPASMQPRCAGGIAETSFGVVVGGTAPISGAQVRTAPCAGGHLALPVGDQLALTDCPVGLSSHVDDPSVLATGTTPAVFTAVKAGSTKIELSVKPQCSPGQMCPQYVRDLGTLVVTVVNHGGPVATPCAPGTAYLADGTTTVIPCQDEK